MVEITRRYKRTRKITEYVDITLSLPAFYTPGHIEDTFQEHAKQDNGLTWQPSIADEDVITGIRHDNPDDQDGEDEPTPSHRPGSHRYRKTTG